VDGIPAVAEGLHHLHDGDLPPQLCEVDGEFYARRSAAEDDDPAARPLRIPVGLLGSEDVRGLDPWDIRDARPGAQRCDDDVRAGRRRVLRCDGGAEPHLDGRSGDHSGLIVEVAGQKSLERHLLLTSEHAAETVLLFAENDRVSAFRGGQRRLHPGHAAADHEHVLGPACRERMPAVLLEAYLGIDGTPVLPLGSDAGKTLEAADAGSDLVSSSRARLLGQVGIGEQRPGDLHHIGLSGGDDLFHHPGIVQGADGRHRRGDMPLDLGGVAYVDAVRKEHARMGDGEDLGHFVTTGGDMDKVDLAVELLGDRHAFVDVVAALVAFRAADADLDREPTPAFLLDPLHDGQREAATVLKAAAPSILALVDLGGEELGEEPAVPGVDGHQAETAELGEGGGVAKSLDRFLDHLFGHRRDGLS